MCVVGLSLMFIDQLGFIGLFLVEKTRQILFSPGGTFSLGSLLSALVIALLYLGYKHRLRRRELKLRVLLRAIFPKRLLWSRSTKADVGFFFFNSFLAGLLFGWAILSAHAVSRVMNGLLVKGFGALDPTALPDLACAVVMTVAIFVAYEFGYWLDHTLSHRIPFLWEFHKVHHTAEVLSPLTNFRVHPVDSLVFVNILAIVMGSTGGVLTYLFGKPITSISLWNINALVLIFTYLLDHLHHTQFWIPFTGVWGRLFISPAHHQIHHSTNPAHFNKNMGSCLAVFDWMFGTLHMPMQEREKLVFGVEPSEGDPHTISEGLITPVTRAFAHLVPKAPEADAATRP